MRHSKVIAVIGEPGGTGPSSAVNVNVAPNPLAPLCGSGPLSTVVSGGVMSGGVSGTMSLRLQTTKRHCSGRPLPLARLTRSGMIWPLASMPPSTFSSSEAMP